MKRLWSLGRGSITAAGLAALLPLSGPAQRAEGRPSPPPARASVTLEVPLGLTGGGRKASLQIEGEHLASDPTSVRAHGQVTLELANGVRLRTLQSRFTVKTADGRGSRVFVEPAATEVMELVVPAGVLESVSSSGAAHFDLETEELTTTGDVTMRFRDGVRVESRQVQVKTVKPAADGERRILITPLPAPAAVK